MKPFPVRAAPRLYYGWVVVAVSALALLLAAGARSAPGVFLLPMVNDLDLDRATVSASVSVGLLLFGLGAPLSGWLIDHFGPRRVALSGLVLVGLAFLLSAFIRDRAGLFGVWGVLSGLGTGVVGSVLGAAVATRWFVRRRGLVTGIFGASTSAGQLLFIPVLTALAQGPGWRATCLYIGGAALALLLPTLLLLKDRPSLVGLRPDGDPDDGQPLPASPRPTPGILRRALGTRSFWLLAASFFVCGATSNGLVGTHFIAFCGDLGLSARYAAGMLALMGGFNFVGTLLSGYLTDRIDPRGLLAVYYAFRGLSLLLLPLVPPGSALLAFAVLFGLDYIATVPPTIALTARNFGAANVGTVYGWVFFAHQLGAAAAAALGGVLRQSLGTYGPSFLAAGVLAVAAALLVRGIAPRAAAGEAARA